VTLAGVGITVGALYTPPVDIVPVALLPPLTPFTCHVTAWFVVFETVAENCAVVRSRVVEGPETLTAIDGGVLTPFTPPEQPTIATRAASKTDERRASRMKASTLERGSQLEQNQKFDCADVLSKQSPENLVAAR
jgi:hypothetical protein